MKRKLQAQKTEYLEQMYYHFMTHDCRLPELFALISDRKLRIYLIQVLMRDIRQSELNEYLNDY